MSRTSLLRGALFALGMGVPLGLGFYAGLTPASPATVQAEHVNDLYFLIFAISIAIFVIVEGLIIWAIVRYRRRDDRLPPQIHGNIRLELIWTAIPTLLVIIIFALSLNALAVVEERVEEVGATIEVDGFQWQWRFRYQGTDVEVTGTGANPPVMRVPVGERVHLVLLSEDVVHAFFVPNFLIKRDVNPYPEGIEPNTLEFTVMEAGEYSGQCAEFCGTGHAAMTFVVHAMERAEFDAWLASEAGGESPAPSGSAAPSGSPGPSGSPAASAGPTGSPAAFPGPTATGTATDETRVTLSADNLEFSTDTLEVPAGRPFTLSFENLEDIPHNVAIYRDGQPVFQGEVFSGPDSRDYAVPALEPGGTYAFVCEVHPDTMVGTLTVTP